MKHWRFRRQDSLHRQLCFEAYSAFPNMTSLWTLRKTKLDSIFFLIFYLFVWMSFPSTWISFFVESVGPYPAYSLDPYGLFRGMGGAHTNKRWIGLRSAIQFRAPLLPKELVERLGSCGKSGLCFPTFGLGSLFSCWGNRVRLVIGRTLSFVSR